jgi:hypothetical protein
MDAKQPIKRADFLKPISREHHQGLLLCWKIKTGLAKGIDPMRIKLYTDWFYNTYMLPHFIFEETILFPILGLEHPLIVKALDEHKLLTMYFQQSPNITESLISIQNLLDAHIRFEERTLFQHIQEKATADEIARVNETDHSYQFTDNTNDPFWI